MRVTPRFTRRVEDYTLVVGQEEVTKLVEESRELQNLKVTHVNSTYFGGGVAEILHSLVPLMNSVGIETNWEVLEVPSEFFEVTKKLHHGLQGMTNISLSEDEVKLYLKWCEYNAETLELASDVIIIHDYQPLAIPYFRRDRTKKLWVWRCHIDISSPNERIWEFVEKYLRYYHIIIVHSHEYVRPEIRDRCYVIHPSIDPLSDKNKELEHNFITKVAERCSIDLDKPVITQVARFDPWKDPFSAIELYKVVRKKLRDVQLLLVSSLPPDDPDSRRYYTELKKIELRDSRIHVLTNLEGVSDLEVNALQRLTTVGIHLATREGFGLAISEFMWKYKPVVARPSCGARMQIVDSETGFLAWDIESLSKKVTMLIKDTELRRRLGLNARLRVLENFVITKHLMKYLKLLKCLLKHKLTGNIMPNFY